MLKSKPALPKKNLPDNAIVGSIRVRRIPLTLRRAKTNMRETEVSNDAEGKGFENTLRKSVA